MTQSARGGSNSITTVKTDLVWPTLTDDKSDTKDVVLFYEEFEDVCALANNCRGMSAREKLLALRARCKGSRAKTYTNAYRAAWKTGEVVDDPEAVYLRIKNKHLMFGESREEREVRIDGEHQALVKGRLSGHQFEPLFEASVADLESVGLGKTARELYLSYLRKMPPHLQKEIRQDKRIWPGDAKEVGLRSPATWEESHKVVLEYEQREAAHRAVAHSTYSTTAGEPSDSSAALAKAQKEIRELRRLLRQPRPGLLARRPRTAPWRPVPAPRVSKLPNRRMYKMYHGINMQNVDTMSTSHHEHFKKFSKDCLTVSHFSRCTLLAWSVASCNGICKRKSLDAIAPIKLEASQSMVAPAIRADPHCILGMLQPAGNCNLVAMRIPERSRRTN